MARSKGVAEFAVNFEPTGQSPLDARLVVDTVADLTAEDTYSAKNYYNGMPVVVLEGPALYVLTDMDNITSSSSWTQLDASATVVENIGIVDNLTSTSTTTALSANQGRVLNEKITALGDVYNVKGTVADKSTLLALTTVKKGDVYNVTAAITINDQSYAAGTNFVYIGDTENAASTESNWDSLGGTFDLSAYYTSAQVDALIESYFTWYEGD